MFLASKEEASSAAEGASLFLLSSRHEDESVFLTDESCCGVLSYNLSPATLYGLLDCCPAILQIQNLSHKTILVSNLVLIAVEADGRVVIFAYSNF